MTKTTLIGVLDLQGGSQEHISHFARLGISAKPVRVPEHLDGLAGIVLPGGESTCLARLLCLTGMHDALKRAYVQGLRFWGTCAGAILLAREIVGESPHLALMDITVERNAFGTQLDSFTIIADVPEIATQPLPLTFIRAPRIVRIGSDVHALLMVRGGFAAVRDPQCLATIFHPELGSALAFHRAFAHMCGVTFETPTPDIDPTWSPADWMKARRA